tara:strand:+ start:224 stop:1171 length:948 start_codon:yes stop_codon:yes gene_type:complete
MKEENNNLQVNNLNGEIDIQEIFSALIQGKRIIISITAFVVMIGIFYSLFLPNIYKSNALLAPVNNNQSALSTAMGEYGGLAALAGISLPNSNKDSNSAKALEMMGALSFFENNIMPKIFLPDLMAMGYWNSDINKISYDDDIYNQSSDSWVRSFSYPKKLIPSAQESFEKFKKKHFDIKQDISSGFITLSVKHQSPYVAKQWVETVVREINNFYRQKDKSKSEDTIVYLNEQMFKTSLREVKEVIAELLQTEIQNLALIEVNENYVFEYIYPPAVMEKKSEPSRTLIFILSTILGVLLGAFIVILRHYFFSSDK